jgi:hypothetical protein
LARGGGTAGVVVSDVVRDACDSTTPIMSSHTENSLTPLADARDPIVYFTPLNPPPFDGTPSCILAIMPSGRLDDACGAKDEFMDESPTGTPTAFSKQNACTRVALRNKTVDG